MKKILLSFTALLVVAICVSILVAGCMINDNENIPSIPDAKPPDVPKVENGEETITISIESIKKFAEESSTVWEFIQMLFTDHIVYKDKMGQYVYEPVNKDLPLSHYDWDNLVRLQKSHKELEYHLDGQAVSIKGIDVSKYQEDIDWKKVADDGVKYAILRLGYRGYTEGKLIMDEKFEENAKNALQNGIPIGVYFVTQAISIEEAVEEAEFVLKNMAPYKVTWPVVLDIEDAASSKARTVELTKEERTDFAVAFCERVKEAGHTPMLYCNIRWFMEELDLTRLTEYDKWFAQYFSRPFFPYEFQIWQYTSSGRVNGIKGNVDLNLSFFDYGADASGDG